MSVIESKKYVLLFYFSFLEIEYILIKISEIIHSILYLDFILKLVFFALKF